MREQPASSHGSFTSVSGESSTSGIFAGLQSRFISSVLLACGVPAISPKMDRVLLPILEILSFVLFVVFSFSGCGIGVLELPVDIIVVIVHPMEFVGDIATFSVVFLFAFVYIMAGVFLLLYIFLSDTISSDSFVVRMLVIHCRLTRTVLLLPLTSIMAEVLAADFFEEKTLEMHHIAGTTVLDFPMFIYLVFGVFGIVSVFLLSTVDALFLLDKFRSDDTTQISTGAPDGRFTFTFVVIRIAVTFAESLIPHSFKYAVFCVFHTLTIPYGILHTRFTPYNAKWVSYVTTILISISVGGGTASMFLVSTESYWSLFALISVPVFVVVSLILVSIRYYLLRKDAVSDSTRSDVGSIGRMLFVISGPFDIAVMFTTLGADKRMPKILSVLGNTSVTKSKELCHMMMGVALGDSGICASILSHVKSIRRKGWMHNEVALGFYRDKIIQLRSMGRNDGNTTIADVRVQRQLSTLRKKEEKLRQLNQYVIGTVISGMEEDGNAVYQAFQQAMSEISEHRTYCERHYALLMESYTTRNVLLRYAAFAATFMNDDELAQRCRKEANSIQRIKPSNMGYGSADGLDTASATSSTMSLGELGSDDDDAYNDDDAEIALPVSAGAMHGGEEDEDVMGSVGTALTNITGTVGSQRSSSRTLRNKMRVLRVWPAMCLQMGLYAFVVALVGVFVACFTLMLIMNGQFEKTSHNIDYLSEVRIEAVAAAHFLRKLQISSYDETDTPFEDERNTASFRERARHACDSLLEHAAVVYDNVPGIAGSWQSDLDLFEHRTDTNGTCWQEYTYQMEEYTLLDGLMTYGEKCLAVLEMNDTQYNDRVVGQRLEEDYAFLFVTLNEPPLYHGLEDVLREFMEEQDRYSDTMKFVFLGLPFSLLLFIPFFLVGYCWYAVTYAASFKGFELARKDHLTKLFRRFDGKLENLGNSRVQLPRFSTAQTFLTLVIVMILVSVAALSSYSLMGNIASTSFNTRNDEYDATCQMQVETRRLHLWAVELLYRDDTFFDVEEIEDGLEEDMHNLQHTFEALRFGEADTHLRGNDHVDYAHEFYYDAPCPSADRNASLEMHEYLRCQTLSRRVFMALESCDHLLKFVHELHAEIDAMGSSNRSVADLRASLHYRYIIELDNDEDDKGALQDMLVLLGEEIQVHFDDLVKLLNNVNILMLLVAMPVILVMTLLLLLSSSSKLSVDVRQTKELLVLLPHDVLMERTMYDYLRGRERLGILQKRRRSSDAKQIVDIFARAEYAIVWFDSAMAVMTYNDQAEDVLNLRVSSARSLIEIFDGDTVEDIREWMRKRYTDSYQPFKGEVTAIYGDSEFTVLLNIVRDETTFIAIIEDVEGAKKKKILEETEKRTKETVELLENILPKEIATQMQRGDRAIVASHKAVTAWFADICNFTGWSKDRRSDGIVGVLHKFFSLFDRIVKRNGMEKIKTIGDCYFAVCGAPVYRPKHVSIAMENAVEVWHAIREFNAENGTEFVMRMGLSSGPITSGVIGEWKWQYDVWGSTINTAARMEQACPTGKIMVSRASYESIYEDYAFIECEKEFQGLGFVKCYIHTPNQTDLDDGVQEEEGETERVIEEEAEAGGEEEEEQLAIEVMIEQHPKHSERVSVEDSTPN